MSRDRHGSALPALLLAEYLSLLSWFHCLCATLFGSHPVTLAPLTLLCLYPQSQLHFLSFDLSGPQFREFLTWCQSQWLSFHMEEDSLTPSAGIFLDSKARTTGMTAPSLTTNLAPWNCICSSFDLLLLFRAEASFYTSWKLIWVRSHPEGAPPFIPFQIRPLFNPLISVSTSLGSNSKFLGAPFLSKLYFLFLFVPAALFHCRPVEKWLPY